MVRSAAKSASLAASRELSEAQRHAANETHRLKARLSAEKRRATEAKDGQDRLAAELEVQLTSTAECHCPIIIVPPPCYLWLCPSCEVSPSRFGRGCGNSL